MPPRRKKPPASLRSVLKVLWDYLKEASGENDYPRYCERVRRSGGSPVSRRAFYLDRLERRHSRPTRCC